MSGEIAKLLQTIRALDNQTLLARFTELDSLLQFYNLGHKRTPKGMRTECRLVKEEVLKRMGQMATLCSVDLEQKDL